MNSERKVRTWAEFRQEWDKVQTAGAASTDVTPILVDEERRANQRMAHLTCICPKCGDEGWWIDDNPGGPFDTGFHYCDCQEGIKRQAEDEQEQATEQR